MSAANGAITAGLAQGLAMVFTTVGVVVAGGATLIEGATLTGVKLLAERQGTAAKIAKVVLVVIAVAAAFLATGGIGFAMTCTVSLYTSSTAIPLLAGVAMAVTTLPAHYKAFQWAELF